MYGNFGKQLGGLSLQFVTGLRRILATTEAAPRTKLVTYLVAS